MGTSRSDDRKFAEYIRERLIGDDALPHILEWIKNNLSPEDVFGIADLESWARDCFWDTPTDEEVKE